MPETTHKGSCFTPLLSHSTITLGVPAYNEAKFIQQTLESIQAQTHKDFAVLISDNASTDGTQAICERIASHDPRFTYVRHPKNIGASSNFNFLRESTASPYFAWVGGHDMLHPDYLRNHLAALNADLGIGNSFSYWEFVNESDEIVRRGCDTGITTPRTGALVRYLWSSGLTVDLGPMHGVFRRKFLCELPIHNCFACDHIMLSNSLYLAPFKSIPGHLYRLRDFDESTRTQNAMQRITGQEKSAPDMHATIAGYLADFDKIVPQGSWHRHFKPFVSWVLYDRFIRRGFRVTTLARSILKRINRIKRFCSGTPSSAHL